MYVHSSSGLLLRDHVPVQPSCCVQAKAVEPQAVVKKFGPEAKEARKKKAEAEKRAAEQKHKQAEEEARKAKAKALYALISLQRVLVFRASDSSSCCTVDSCILQASSKTWESQERCHRHQESSTNGRCDPPRTQWAAATQGTSQGCSTRIVYPGRL